MMEAKKEPRERVASKVAVDCSAALLFAFAALASARTGPIFTVEMLD